MSVWPYVCVCVIVAVVIVVVVVVVCACHVWRHSIVLVAGYRIITEVGQLGRARVVINELPVGGYQRGFQRH